MQCNSVTVPSHSFKFTTTSFRPEVDAAHAQHDAGQRRAMSELQLIGDVTTADVQLDTGRTVAAEHYALYSYCGVVVSSRQGVSWPGHVAVRRRHHAMRWSPFITNNLYRTHTVRLGTRPSHYYGAFLVMKT